MAESGGGEPEVAAEVREGLAAEVPQLDVLEVAPDALVRVQVRGVAGERLQADALGPAGGQEVLDRLAAMDRRAVPEDQELAGDVAEQVLEEADDVRALVGASWTSISSRPAGVMPLMTDRWSRVRGRRRTGVRPRGA